MASIIPLFRVRYVQVRYFRIRAERCRIYLRINIHLSSFLSIRILLFIFRIRVEATMTALTFPPALI